MKKSSGIGCAGIFAIMIVVSLLVTYWYVALAFIVLAGAFWWYWRKQKAAEDAQKAAAAERKTQTQRQIEQLRQFKQLLDEGAITQAEYDRQKRKLLDDDGPDDLQF